MIGSLSKPMAYVIWWLRTICSTFPYQKYWNMTYDDWGSYPLQFHVKIVEIWPRMAMAHLLFHSFSKSMRYDLYWLRAMSFTIPYQNNEIWRMVIKKIAPVCHSSYFNELDRETKKTLSKTKKTKETKQKNNKSLSKPMLFM